MTDQEWECCTDPRPMLSFLRTGGRASDRKLRLFAIACCYRVWERIEDPRSRAAVEFADRHAEGGLARRRGVGVVRKDVRAAFRKAWEGRRVESNPESNRRMMAAYAVEGLLTEKPWEMVPWNAGQVAPDRNQAWQSDLLRDIFGNPFRPIAVDRAWLAWHGGAAVKLAAAVYEERELPSGHLDAARLAVLADMLEEAGCAEAELLGHLRGPGPHVRGCWAIDLILGKE